jgi:glycosyltransferase involved in cell wall biosynthesis
MVIAYLINQYPQPSQSFIRREVQALEVRGMIIQRFTLRAWTGTLADARDEQERQRTRVVLSVGALGLLWAGLKTILGRPRKFFQALGLTLRVGTGSERGLLIHLIYLAEACVLREWLAAERIGHVHAHFGTNSSAVAMLCRVLGGPTYSFTLHGPLEFDRPRYLYLREKIHYAMFVAAITNYCRSQLYRWADYSDWPKIHVVPCDIEEMFFKPTGMPFPTAPRMVCVGRLVEQKGQLLLVQAAGQLRREGFDFEIVLVGDGPMRGAIEKLIEQLDLVGRVRIAGFLSNADVRQTVIESRALVVASFAEGLPSVIMEAMALERPVISTSVAAIPELLEHGKSGWLIPPGSVEALAGAMREALTTPLDRLAEMGRAGKARITARHESIVAEGTLFKLLNHAAENGSLLHPNGGSSPKPSATL